MLAVDVIMRAICNVQQLFSILVKLTTLVDLQFRAHVEVVFRAVENRIRLVVVRVNWTLLEFLIAAFAIGIIRIVIIVGIVGGDQTSAVLAGGVAILIATGT